VLLPFVLIFMILLVNKRGLMREWTNSRAFNLVSWVTVVVMIGLTLALLGSRCAACISQRLLCARMGSRWIVYRRSLSKIRPI